MGAEIRVIISAKIFADIDNILQARAMSHLEEISDAGIEKMAEAGSVAVLLPSTAFILRLKPPPARKMIEKGIGQYD